MENQQEVTLTIERGDWSPLAAEYVAQALPFAPVEGIAAQVESGAALLFYVREGREMVGCYVLRVEGREGVIVAASGNCAGVDLTQLLLAHVENQFIDVDALRIHTARPGMVRRLQAAGYTPQEFVMRKEKCKAENISMH